MIEFNIKIVSMYENGRAKDYYFVEWDDPKGLTQTKEDLLIDAIFATVPDVHEAGISVVGDYKYGRYEFPTVQYISKFTWYQMNRPVPRLLPGDYHITGAVFRRMDQAEKFKDYLDKKLTIAILAKEY